jgi:hypothetical protein
MSENYLISKDGSKLSRFIVKSSDGKSKTDLIQVITGLREENAAAFSEFAAAIKKLQKRLSELSEVKYVGVYQQSLSYRKGNFATYQGSLFSCTHDTQERPGTGIDWQLCAKSGNR